jgi:hypothetical protein
MQERTSLGTNRTGVQMSPFDVDEQLRATDRLAPDAPGDATLIADLRSRYAAEASPIGSIPVPGTMKGMLKTGVDKLTGHRPELLVDKLGERLAFERSGSRLYDALIAKCASLPDPGLPLDELRAIRDDEIRHFRLVAEAIESLGADPTAQTPCADAMGVATMGLMQVVTDPRTTVAQSLDAALIAELADNAGWDLLCDLARRSGHDAIAERFESARLAEQAHLDTVRGWLRNAVLQQARS